MACFYLSYQRFVYLYLFFEGFYTVVLPPLFKLEVSGLLLELVH